MVLPYAESFLKVERLIGTGNVRIEFMAADNLTYTVEYTDGLENMIWRTLADAVAEPARTVVLSDPNVILHRFYRLVTPRQP